MLSRLPELSFLTTGTFEQIVLSVINWILVLAGALAVIYLVYGGILYITAGGDAEKATKGRTALVNAIIGIVIIILAFLIVVWVNRLINTGRT
ncbi:MAG TPA: hypothetical protein VJK26_02060 [Patescibacteria group bacterium]|nr:hypothetical protein [Patescibacteria group bacterium]